MPHSPSLRALVTLPLLALGAAAPACGGGSAPIDRVSGQSDFLSAPPPGTSGGAAGDAKGGANAAVSGSSGSSSGGSNAPSAAAPAPATSTQTRDVQETDLYRLDQNRLYYLNAYRGLMVFDLTDVDHPRLLGRSPIFGTPVQMFVQNGLAVVVVADWYGTMDNGQPFHGSIVRGLDATDPTNIQVVGEAKLGGWIQDTRIVGNVLYAVSEDYGWVYDWSNGGVSSASTTPSVIVSSVSFANNQISQVSSKTYAGYGGVFNVTPSSILLAHPAPAADPTLPPPARTILQYLDISDPGGAIVERGSINVPGSVQGWGADNGRWNLDFADGKTAHVIGCSATYDCSSGYILATADFTNPDQPVLDSELPISSGSWSGTARFDSSRMYLSPSGSYSYSSSTPLEIFDLTNPAAPALAGQTQIPGSVWLMMPSGNQLFALGQDDPNASSRVSLKYLDVTNAAAPTLIGTSTFGDSWAWTPAAQTFKAFTMDPTQGLVVLPFSGWSASAQQYNNGVQLIEFSPTSITTAGAAHTKGWVERGIFANGRIVSLSDLALSVVDYSDPLSPAVTAELTLARNVIAAQPSGATIAEISSDWWNNDLTSSEVRVLPSTDASELSDQSQAPTLTVPGTNARVFTNQSFAYVVTGVPVTYPCPYQTAPGVPPQTCTALQTQVEVVDLSNGAATPRGTVKLPFNPNGYFYGYGGWAGFYYYDWYLGDDVVQVDGDALAFRQWQSNYGPNGQYLGSSSDLFIADLSNPDAPSVATTVITSDPNGWWGNMKVVGDTLYTTHYIWPSDNQPYPTLRYYLDRIDLTNRQQPKVEASINVPGVLVGGSTSDPDVLYTIDYRWDGTINHNDFDAIRVSGNTAFLQSRTPLDDGWVGNVIIRGQTAYASTEEYTYVSGQPALQLHQIDLSNPTQPVDRVASGPNGWGWLLDVQGDRMLVTSGWGQAGLDIYRLSANAAPTYDQFVRTEGWSLNSASRQDNQLFLSSGYWGVQTVDLNP